MNCRACGGPLPSVGGACVACGALPGLPVEGALAPDPASRPVPAREPTGKKRRERERHWKDEVRERMDRRRQRESGAPPAPPGLPLFPEPARPADSIEPAVGRGRVAEPPPERELADERPAGPTELGSEPEAPVAEPDGGLLWLPSTAPAPLVEGLSLRPVDQPTPQATPAPAPPSLLDEEPAEPEGSEGGDGWSLGEAHVPAPAAMVDRPALAVERLQAALVDLGILAALWTGVLYFAARAARVPLSGLQPAWPWLLGYLALLGLLYAAYFTGTTGQTLGKMLFGLRVVGRSGRVPGYPAALGRAALGTLSASVAGLGLVPMLFDPARRALHDRLFGTRVVRPAPPGARLT